MYEIIESYLKNNKTGMIATVILQAGSAPRDTGAKMFVGEDGKSFGTVGGGRLEFGVCQEAMTIMGKGTTKKVHIRMDAKEVTSGEMICGGNVDVLLEPVFEKYRTLYGRLEYLEKKGKAGVLVTRFSENSFVKTLIEEDLTITVMPCRRMKRRPSRNISRKQRHALLMECLLSRSLFRQSSIFLAQVMFLSTLQRLPGWLISL